MRFFWLVCLVLFFNCCWSFNLFTNNQIFYTVDGTSYVENTLKIPVHQLALQEIQPGVYQARVEVLVTYSVDTTLVKADRYTLRSVEITDTNNIDLAILDMQRYFLPAGAYLQEMLLIDVNNKANNITFQNEFTVLPLGENLTFSEPMMVEKFTPTSASNKYSRGGQDMIPYPINFFPTEVQKIGFYIELYNAYQSGKDKLVFASSLVNENNGTTIFSKVKTFKTDSINVFSRNISLDQLPSGNYAFDFSVVDDNQNVKTSKRFKFQRVNKNVESGVVERDEFIRQTFVGKLTDEKLIFYLRSLTPIASSQEKSSIRGISKSENIKNARKYFYAFWTKRSPIDPKTEWEQYKQKVDYTEYHYKTTIQAGFETDRGYTYLKYGIPNNINRERGNNVYDHEIWNYYRTNDNQNNVQFIFYNKSMTPNDYIILHSNARGEISNGNWKNDLRPASILDEIR